MRRTFAVARRGNATVVHDPATGLTHQSEQPLPPGRRLLDAEQVHRWPILHPSACDGKMPISVCWSPIVRCNLSCPHCLDDKNVSELGATDRHTIATLIGAAGILGVDISGGEPLLLGDLGDLADELTFAGCVVSLTTNGWHLKRRARQLADRLDAVKVSLDGPTAALHDAWRGEGSFERALAGITEAVAAGMCVQIQSVLMASNRAQAQDLVRLAHQVGAEGVTFLQMLPIGEAPQLPAAEMVDDEDAQALINALTVPADLGVRLRTRQAAGGFTVVRADGRVWRNDRPAQRIQTLRPLRSPIDLALSGPDGSA